MNSVLESLFEILYPEKNICCICGIYDENINSKYMCVSCFATIKRIVPPVCTICGRSISSIENNTICRDCAIHERFFTKARSPFRYEGLIKKCIHLLKYENKPHYYRFFGNALVEYIISSDCIEYDIVTSVPLHKSKLRKRGYNQAKLIAQYIASHTRKPYADLIIRNRATPKQSEQSRILRLENLKDAFEAKNKKASEKTEGLRVLLVDDIYTTGATANECAKTLKGMGAAAVYVLTAAR